MSSTGDGPLKLRISMEALVILDSLLQQACGLYRRVSSTSNFADHGHFSALLLIEYVRFETWLLSNGVIIWPPMEPHRLYEDALEGCVLVAKINRVPKKPNRQVAGDLSEITASVVKHFQDLDRARQRHSENTNEGDNHKLNPTTEEPALLALKDQRPRQIAIRQHLMKVPCFYCRGGFAWSSVEDVLTRDEVKASIHHLTEANDALDEFSP
ncbi:hypothetical protein B0T10DRAFT_550651 [Thelonectria olida]|uniref:Uncharacterized protein n=1 Tax=Thelonectria olida TaxID=1576542 RepID=A0A9P8W2G7_9HYPO|nr:hypothetical protein B0T10DRAFT_550651 [Thelonectria olida]